MLHSPGMTDATKQPEPKKPEATSEEGEPTELNEKALETVSGGVARRGGDDDLDDLEVERARIR